MKNPLNFRGFVLYVPWLKPQGMALFPFVLVKIRKPSPRLLNHERIHLRQQLEMLVVPFYLWYLSEYFINRLKYKNHYYAYRKISFEAEAYAHDDDPAYLQSRQLWAFLKYF